MINGTHYTIAISSCRDNPEDQPVYYKGTAPDDFPDIAFFGRHPGEAYWGVVDAIEGLVMMNPK